MLDTTRTTLDGQPCPTVSWVVQQRGPCGTLREVAVFGNREDADELAQCLRERGLAVCLCWRRG